MKHTLLMLSLAVLAFAAAYGVTKFGNAPPDPPPGMVWVPGGEFTMGGFRMDETDVTNAQFRAFVVLRPRHHSPDPASKAERGGN